MFALLGEEQRHHPVAVVPVGGRTEQDIHRHPPADPDHAGGRIVARLAAVQLVTFVHQNGRQRFCRIAHIRNRLHKGNDVVVFPAEIIGHAHSRMRTAVAHGDEQIALAQADHGFINLFAADIHLGFRIVVMLSVPYQNHHRVVVLDHLRLGIVHQMNDGKGGIRHSTHRADRQSRRNGGNAVLQRQPLRHHRGNDLGGQRGKDACFYAASQSVRKHDDRRIVSLLHDVHMVAAELFALVVDAFISDIRT